MPVINVRHSAGSLDRATKADLAGRLSDVLIRMEGGANTPEGRAFAWVCFTECGQDDLWIAGHSCGDRLLRAYLIHISIPEGYMNCVHKDEVHAWIDSAIKAATHVDGSNSRILTIIDEVAEGNWGSQGAPISLESIAAAVGQPAGGPRLTWSRSYFAAKARAMAAAGFPVDAGGLLPSMMDERGRLSQLPSPSS